MCLSGLHPRFDVFPGPLLEAARQLRTLPTARTTVLAELRPSSTIRTTVEPSAACGAQWYSSRGPTRNLFCGYSRSSLLRAQFDLPLLIVSAGSRSLDAVSAGPGSGSRFRSELDSPSTIPFDVARR